jgi:NDP-hexose-3-ketoreductase
MISTPNRRLRMGVVGCADIAWRRTLPAMVAGGSIEVAAVGSRSKDKAEKFADRFGGAAVEGYAALLDRDDVDAVYIPLPALMHTEWVARSLEAGKHVLVEKPMSGSLRDTAGLIELACSRDLVLVENYMFLHHSQHATAQKMLADGVIGDLRSFSSSFTFPPKPAGDIRYQRDVGGGAFTDFGGYSVRAAQLYLDGDLDVIGAVFRHDLSKGVVLAGNVLLTTVDGVTAQLEFGMEHSYRNSYCLSGSTGRLSLDRVFTPAETYRPVLRVDRQDHTEEFTLAADDQVANVLVYFLDAVLGSVDVRSAQEATLRQAALIEQIEQKAVHIKI